MSTINFGTKKIVTNHLSTTRSYIYNYISIYKLRVSTITQTRLIAKSIQQDNMNTPRTRSKKNQIYKYVHVTLVLCTNICI
jgi:hypothetical protein